MGVSENEIGLREGRARFGDLVNRAQYAGEITIITKHGRPAAAIVPINRIAPEATMTVTAADLAKETGTTVEDVLALVDQLTTLDSSEAIVIAGSGADTSLTAEAAEQIRAQLSGQASYTLSLIEGEDRYTFNGVELGADESPISYADLDAETIAWLDENGYDDEHPNRWVLVTPADEDPAAVNVIDSRTVTV